MSPLAAALLAEWGEGGLRELAALLHPHLATIEHDRDDQWMDSKAAARYLGMPSVHPLHKLTAARSIPFEQNVPGGKCWFKRSELDAWRRR
jgi:hypothetical protein